MKRAISIVATVATLTAASATHAAEHTILILPGAYFPQVTYLKEGDTVHFQNWSGAPHSIIAKNDSWEMGPIADEGQASSVIAVGVQKTFYDQASQGEDGAYLVEGRMSFSDAPLD